MGPILIIYYSRTGTVAEMATYVMKGALSQNVTVNLRRIASLGEDSVEGPLFVTNDDLRECSGLIMGSPTRFGQMAACVRSFWDKTGDIWYGGQLEGKPAGVFTSSSSMHGGQESTLLGMMMPLIHHGMLVTGIPYSEKAIEETESGGGPYGASVVAQKGKQSMTEDEKVICQELGMRIAKLAKKLHDE
mgnify:CR=1 FL=1